MFAPALVAAVSFGFVFAFGVCPGLFSGTKNAGAVSVGGEKRGGEKRGGEKRGGASPVSSSSTSREFIVFRRKQGGFLMASSTVCPGNSDRRLFGFRTPFV